MRRRKFAKEMYLMTDTEQEKIDAYLRRVTAGLRGMPAEQVREIVAELRSHISDKLMLSDKMGADESGTDKTGATGATRAQGAAELESVLAKLGEPAKLAAMYLIEELQARAGEAGRARLRWGSPGDWHSSCFNCM